VSGASFYGSAADLQDWAMRQPEVGRCLFCPEWVVEGTADEINLLLLEHRNQHHPEVCEGRRRRRPSRGLLLSFRQKLNEEQSEEIQIERSRRMRLLGISDQ
jgi:hypothetical protein